MTTIIHDNDFSYNVDKLTLNNDIGKHGRFNKFMRIAEGLSELSNFNQYKLGALIVVKGQIVARGWNKQKSHPQQKHYNEFRSNLIEDTVHSTHAEIDALNKAKNMGVDLSKAEIIIYRRGRDKQQKMARPCAACMRAIKVAKISVLHYSTPDGLATEYININKPIKVKRATQLI